MLSTYPEKWPEYKSQSFSNENLLTKELIAYVHDGPTLYGKDYEYYMEKWIPLLNKTRKISGFNWPACVFSFLWFLYRKMYLKGFLVYITEFLIIVIISISVAITFYGSSEYLETMGIYPALISVIAVRIIWGFTANLLYLKHTINYVIKSRLKTNTIEDRIHFLTEKGGKSSLALFIGLLLYYILKFLMSHIDRFFYKSCVIYV